MKSKKKLKFSEFKIYWLLQPVLVALFPVIQMFAINPSEINYTQFFLATTIISTSVIFLFLSCFLIYKNKIKAIILTNSLVLLFYLSTPIINFLLIPISKSYFIRVRYTLPIIIIISVYFIHKFMVQKIKTHFFLKMFLLPLIVILGTSFTSGVFRRKKLQNSINKYKVFNKNTRKNLLKKLSLNNIYKKPDIYFIIVDSYARKDYLKEVCNFDNEPFLQSLKDRGFYIANKSNSNYPNTIPSLPATLNMGYIPEAKNSYPYFFTWINNNVSFLLKKLGYSYIDLSKEDKSFWSRLLDELNILLTDGSSMGGIYIESWTPLYAFLYKFYFENLRKKIHQKFKIFESTISLPSPKFIYLHVYPPHPPHVLDNKGNLLLPDYSKSDSENAVHGYLESIRYLNNKIIKIIDQILKKSKSNPVIILQADHGLDHTNKNIQNKFKILNAYYLPDGGDKKLYPTISPVNNFRLIFNHYFGTSLPLLEDKISTQRGT